MTYLEVAVMSKTKGVVFRDQVGKKKRNYQKYFMKTVVNHRKNNFICK